jgi:hypothetical protein
MTLQALPMLRRLFAVAVVVVLLASSSAIADVPESRARFTDIYAEAARQAMQAVKVQTIGELEVRVQFPDGRTATFYLDNAYEMYLQAPERRDAIIAFYVERGLKNATDDDRKIDATRVIPIIRGRASIMIAHAERNPKSPDAVLFEHLGADLFIIYGENLQQALRDCFENRSVRDSAGGWVVIQALDVDRAEPWPDGQDRQEDQTLPVGSDGRGVGSDRAADAQARSSRPAARG